MAGLRSFRNVPLSEVPTNIRSGQSDAQLNIGYLDVTKAPYNCDNTGATNCTTGFQLALDHGYLYNFAVWAPKGTYLLTRLYMYQIERFGNFGGSNRKHAMQVIGDTVGGNWPTLRCAAGLGANPFILLLFSQASLRFPEARIYNCTLRGFRIDMQNNPTSTAVSFAGAQWCSLQDLDI